MPGVLDGIRVLDFGRYIAGPWCAALLGDLGAEVIRVEKVDGGEDRFNYEIGDEPGSGSMFLQCNRNKKGVTLNPTKPEGREIQEKLIATADVVIANMPPRALEQLGLDYENLKAIKPDIILVTNTAFGTIGPYAKKVGFDSVAQAMSGNMIMSGSPGEPAKSFGPYVDYGTAGLCAFGTMAAIMHRNATGEGQVIDMALYESIFRFLDELVPAYAKEGTIRQREGMGTKLACPHGHFQTGDDKWVSIACTSDKMFERLTRVMGKPELAGSDMYETTAQRIANRETVDGLVTDFTRSYTQTEVLQKCNDGEVPCGAINSVADIFEDPQFEARDNLLRFNDPDAGEIVVPGVIPKLSKTPGRVKHVGPPLGDGIEGIYGDLLGMSAAEIAALKEKGVI